MKNLSSITFVLLFAIHCFAFAGTVIQEARTIQTQSKALNSQYSYSKMHPAKDALSTSKDCHRLRKKGLFVENKTKDGSELSWTQTDQDGKKANEFIVLQKCNQEDKWTVLGKVSGNTYEYKITTQKENCSYDVLGIFIQEDGQETFWSYSDQKASDLATLSQSYKSSQETTENQGWGCSTSLSNPLSLFLLFFLLPLFLPRKK